MCKSLQLCDKRLDQVVEEDRSLLEYVAFLRQKEDEYESIINQLQAEVSIHQKKNEKLTNLISDQNLELKQTKRQTIPKRTLNIMTITEETYKGNRNAKAKPHSDSDEGQSEEGNTDHDQH